MTEETIERTAYNDKDKLIEAIELLKRPFWDKYQPSAGELLAALEQKLEEWDDG